MIYRHFLRPLLFTLPTEGVHELAMAGLRAAGALPGLPNLTRNLLRADDPALTTECLGLTFPNPVGLAAGFDKNAVAVPMLSALGFGFVEVGTLTSQAQAGNPRPRLFRLPADRALINRLGFNNVGALTAAARLKNLPRMPIPVGVNVGKLRTVEASAAASDYAKSARTLAPMASYMVVNVSSPNTPGLRALQAIDQLEPIVDAVRVALKEVAPNPPLLLKIAPDLELDDVSAIAEFALRTGIDGVIATNTSVVRSNLRTNAKRVERLGAGGLSGAPIKARALEVLRRLAEGTRGRITLIACGGIENADDAWERMRYGATLIQVYTGFVYGGPMTARRIALGLARRARAAGYHRVQDAVGTALGDATQLEPSLAK